MQEFAERYATQHAAFISEKGLDLKWTLTCMIRVQKQTVPHHSRAFCFCFYNDLQEVMKMKMNDRAQFERQNVFGTGTPNDAYAQYFVGHSFLNPLTDPKCGVFLANVTFEPGCRNNWHIHHAAKGGGQILICTAGKAVSGGRETGCEPCPGLCHNHSAGGEALARCQGGQLVQSYCH